MKKDNEENMINFTCLFGNNSTTYESEIERKLEGEEIDYEFIEGMFKAKEVMKEMKEEEERHEFTRRIFNDDEVYKFGGKIVENSEVVIDSRLIAYQMGCTACVVMIKDGYIYVANCGDSLAVLYQGGISMKINLEHNMKVDKEVLRIKESGCRVINNRVEGKLNLTRAIGDFMFKQSKQSLAHEHAVIAYPEVKKLKLKEDMEFILLGCDGIWDCVDRNKVCQFISQKLKEGNMSKSEILSRVFEKISSASHPMFGSDNMSCILIDLREKAEEFRKKNL